MELIAVTQRLWRYRILVGLGAVLAIGAAFVMGPSPTPPRGFAMTRVLVDTSRSQLAQEATFGAGTLPWRAALASQTLGTDANRRAIAAGAGIRPDQLDIADIALTNPTVPASLPRAAVQAAYSSAKPYAIDVSTDGTVPLITISASAPDRESAVKLAESTVAALQSYIEVPASTQRMALRVRTVSPMNFVARPGGHGRKRMAAIVVIFVCMWIATVALMPVALGAARRALQDADPVRP